MNTAVWIFLAFILIGTVSSFAKLFGFDWPAGPRFANEAERRRCRWTCIAWGGLVFLTVAARKLVPQIPSALMIGAFLVLAVFSHWLIGRILFPDPHENPQ